MERKVRVLVIGNYNVSVIKKCSPGHAGCWGTTIFDFDSEGVYNYVVVLNYPKRNYQVCCPPNNVWAVIQEPYVRGTHEWMKKGHEVYSKVFTHDPPSNDAKYIRSPPLLCWFVGRSYDDLVNCPIPEKISNLSCVSSNRSDIEGHKKRISFINSLLSDESIQFDLYGRGFNPVKDKWDALAPYYFSIAIENTSKEDYWTEKIADCFLSYTVPIYYGCTNIADYFPAESYIEIDINNHEEAKEIIKQSATKDEWERRLPHIKKARDLVLNDYNILNVISNEMKRQNHHSSNCCHIPLKKYRHSAVDLLLRFFDKY